MKQFYSNPLFIFGLLLRITLVLTLTSFPVNEWYVSFLRETTLSFNLNPWDIWLKNGGSSIAFPYGYVMWLVFLPAIFICKLFGISLEYGYGFTLILFDLFLLLILSKLTVSRNKLLVKVYWLSPIVILSSYFFGYNDLIPVTILFFSVYLLRKVKLRTSGFALIAAISAKSSMVLAVPYFIIYFIHNKSFKNYSPKIILGAAVGFLLLIVPFLFSASGLNMLLSNPEISKIYQFSLKVGNDVNVYLIVLSYVFILHYTWRIKKLNFELFHTMCGISFLLVVLLTSASPGWFIWIIPLIVTYQIASDSIAIIICSIFSVLYIFSTLLSPSPHDEVTVNSLLNWDLSHFDGQEKRISSIVQTLLLSTGIILAFRIWRETVTKNDFFRFSKKPFVIGVAGDSGAGKDTFCNALIGLFGNHSTTMLSGDDYHFWDRHKPMWSVMTHLNPMANDLEGFGNDLINLIDGKKIRTRHYDHQTGRMSRPFSIETNDIILASGLHALYHPIFRECYNLSIYLDIDEGLRRYFKIKRDVHQRGHDISRVISSLEKREPDSIRFIKPQKKYADIIFSLQPIHPNMLSDDNNHSRELVLKLSVFSNNGFNEHNLIRVLIGVCGLHVDIISSQDSMATEIIIEGETASDDISMAVKLVCPKVLEFLDIEPVWEDGFLGIMQLFVLSQINQSLMKRFIS